MKQFTSYLRPALYNMLQNKLYALFCVAGTALTFIFVVLILQLMHIYTSNYPPMTYADRIIRLEYFNDMEGNECGGIRSYETTVFLEDLKDFDRVSLYHQDAINVMVNNQIYTSMIGFVNAGFWGMYDFEFLYGRPFSKEDCINRKAAVVITENMSYSFFNTGNSIGKKITFQQNEYEIIGIVKNFSLFSTPTDMCTIWAPYVFNKFIPNATYTYIIDVFTPHVMSMDDSKEKIAKAVQHYFEKREKKVDFPPKKVRTIKEISKEEIGGNMFKYGGIIGLILFLFIPALNILSLSITHTNNRAEEIALRKTFGASRISSFFQIMVENLLLVMAGTLIGLILSIPAMNLIQQNIMSNSFMGNLSLVAHIDYLVIFAGVLPAMIVFSLLSGGLPAYLISKRSIAQVLKGGSI